MSSKTNKPWNLEIYRGFDSSFTEDQLLINRPIREFLDTEDKFVLVGAKGLGKTLFLRYKSYLYHNLYGDSINFNTSQTELTENLNIHADTFSKEELLGFRDEGLWRLIWELTLWIMLFRLIKVPINARLEKLVESASELSTILAHLLNHRKKVDQYRSYVNEFQGRKSKVQSAVALFIDDVDQALHALLEDPHSSDEYFEGRQSPSVEVWVNAQIGLLGAIYNLNRQNAHIKIYATIRREAFEAFDGEMKINYRHHVSILDYDKEEIQEIFEKNIQLIPSEDLIKRNADSAIERFLGFESLPHRFAVDPKGKRRVETAFDFIYRHTYGRPREIVLMGKEIDGVVRSKGYINKDEEGRFEMVRNIVNKWSDLLLRQYRQEIVPYLNEEKLRQFVLNARSNVIPKGDFLLFDKELLRQYYNLGLIGIVKPSSNSGVLKQVFNPPAMYNYRNFRLLPSVDYLLIHPTMDAMLMEVHTLGNFHNPYNIIGDGYDFYPRMDNLVHRTEYYIPKDIVGDRMATKSDNGGHDFPMSSIYANFFSFENAQNRHERLHMSWRTAEQVLGLLGRICYCYLLEKNFKTKYYDKKRSEYTNQLASHFFIRQYNTEMHDDVSETSFDRFLDKLMGRYIVLGCYLVLDMRVEWIHTLLTKGSFEFKKGIGNKDSAMAYLSRSFFIRDLKREEPRNPRNHVSSQLKQRIFNFLSDFEQDSLKAFIRNASDEVKYLEWIETGDHKEWLQSHILQRLWKPA